MAIHPGPGPDPACRQVTRIGDRRRRVAHAHRAARRHADPKPDVGRGMPRVAVRLVGDQVTARDQFVALDRGAVVDGPPILAEGLGGVLDTND